MNDSSPSPGLAMGSEDQNFLDFLDEYDNVTDLTYVVSGEVTLCPKQEVNAFGASFIPAFYFTNFLFSFLGNGLVLFILYKFEKLSSVTNVFLLNLVASNVLFAASLPFWAVYHLDEWRFGAVMCKAVSAAYSVGFSSSVLFLTLMTLDRYLAVVHAVVATRRRRLPYAVAASAAVWTLSVAASLKDLVLQNVRRNPELGLVCEEFGYPEPTMARWRRVSYYQQFVLFFLLPLAMVIYCYASIALRILNTRMKEKCRAVKLIFVIVFTFFVCWTPYNVVIVLRAVRIGDVTSCQDEAALDYALYVTRNLAYCYCCVSPVFYTFVGKKFQSHFRRILVQRVPGLRNRISLSSQTTRTTPQSAYEY